MNIPVLGKEALNTHFFDGKLEEAIQKHLFKDIERVKHYTKEKKNGFVYLQQKKGYTPAGINCLNTIIQTYEQCGRGGGNYDSINYLYACDLLYLVYEKIIKEEESPEIEGESFKMLVFQLDEMASGMCAQGRTIRLLQVLLMMKKEDVTS